MHLKFAVSAQVFNSSTKKLLNENVLNRVIVCNKEGCTYAHITKIEKGNFEVDFDLRPLKADTTLSSTLKFHFYTGNKIPIVVAAGGVKMDSIIGLTQGSPMISEQFSCNFSPVMVSVHFHPPAVAIVHGELPTFENSCLKNTAIHGQLTQLTNAGVSNILRSKLDLKQNIGAPMFTNLTTAHNFDSELTSHINYQEDVQPNKVNGKLFYKSGLTMTALAETMNNLCLHVSDVLQMENSDPKFTNVIANVCQSFMRSAHACPYVSDKVLSPELDNSGALKHLLSESFKLPLHEPYLEDATYLCADDCEGQAAFMLHLFHSFGFLYEKHNVKSGLYKHYEVAMPQHMFKMNDEEKSQMWKLAMKIGSCVSNKSIKCHVALVCAGGASLGDNSSDVGGHATCLLENTVASPHVQIMEGTNSMLWDDDMREIDLGNELVPMKMSLVQIANMLTMNLSKIMGCGAQEHPDYRKLIHLNSKNEDQFYKTVYLQNGVLLASHSQDPIRPNYGITMKNICNTNVKILMPVTGNLINSLSKSVEAYTFCKEHREKRRDEIHPPLASKEKIMSIVSHWTPISSFKELPILSGKNYKLCMAMKSIRDPEEREAFANEMNEKIMDWNHKYADLGVCTQYVAMDTVFTRLHLWIDDMDKLKTTLQSKMAN